MVNLFMLLKLVNTLMIAKKHLWTKKFISTFRTPKIYYVLLTCSVKSANKLLLLKSVFL